MTPTTSCLHCGHGPSADRPSVLWSMSVADGARRYACAPCTRSALTVIESGTTLLG